MDDELFQNAWSETTNKIPSTLKDDPQPSWTSPKLVGEEADLAAPSWSTGADIRWNEPTGSPGFSWSHAEPDLAWGSSVYETIAIGKTPVEEEPPATPEDAPEAEEPPDEQSVSPVEQAHTPGPTTPSPPPAPVLPDAYEVTPELVAPPSPDGFGSFETGLSEQSAASPGFPVEDDPWAASAWADTKAVQPETPEEPVDEWERARQEKLKLDRRVPPELLANIIRQCEELGREICPDPSESSAEEDTWRNDWRSGMDGVPGLPSLVESILPPPTLQPPVRFAQSLIAKKMAGTVKLTKNLPLSKRSPMSHYLAAKGSTAWETSVKEHKEIVDDDIPVGWRIVEKAAPTPSSDSAKEKKSGGRLFSFWGRRQSQISPVSTTADGATESRSASLEKPKSPVIAEMKMESRRASQESIRSSMSGNQTQVPRSTTDSPTSSQPPVAFAATASNAAPTMSSYGSSATDPVQERSGTPPAPSAVSRFLNRFSRRGSTQGGSPRSSLALSSDDLEFLSDIVPSASDDPEDDSADALEKFVNTRRETAVPVLPPPLAPPPKAPGSRPASAASKAPSSVAQSNPLGDDLSALFGSLASGHMGTPSSSASATGGQTSVPTLPPPLAPSRAITPSATPGTGPSRPSLPATSASSSSRPPSRVQTATPPISGFALPPPPSFKPIAPSKPTMMAPKPQLSFPLPKPPASQVVERAPSSASSSSSRTSYETAAETSPTSPSSASPTSSLPLASLYPNIATPISPPLASSQPILAAHSPNNGSSSPSGLATPLATSFSPAPSSLHPSSLALAPPPQNLTATSPSTVPLTHNLWDDDDFSDFQSPVEPPSKSSPSIPPPIAKSPPKHAAPVPAARSHTAAPNLAPFSFPLPPPPANTTRASTAAPSTNLSAFDDDDFADFQDSPSSATALKPGSAVSSSSSLFPTSVSDQMLLTPRKSSGFDDMSGFLESTLATPSPPRVPAKPTAVKPLAPPPSSSTSMPSVSSTSSSSSLLSRRKSHAAEHLHTLNLLEKAAARPGRWPAPPSPLPEAIPGPMAGPSTTSSQFNLLDDQPPVATSSSLAPSFSSPAMLSPARPSSRLGGAANGAQTSASITTSASSNSSLSSSLLQGWDFGGAANAQQPPSGNQRKPANGTQGGGLSAQDLSFFESL
ncbi:hypothetical protein PYCCODRAFT_1410043 [Trametes coccinea BRFM310]|uniref:Uncharacterized protein n=1 Tax=Trametes coccinea (strain BRFM310) TaxID=1353009 RepID=A0A1Y2IPN2_TRAC3|nr:hypothetical protein PYCCODRAFT_1410043 [Trametes coccinea BRFM310]